MPRSLAILLAATGLAIASSPAHAVVANWTDWTARDGNHVDGSVTVGSATVQVDFDGAVGFAQTDGGTNYWIEPDASSRPYTGGTIENAPPASDIIGLIGAGSKTITFSQSVTNPLIALVSWNGNVADFGTPIEIVSQGRGFWGTGTLDLNDAGDGFTGVGEAHGIIRLLGTFSSITFTDAVTENWHGITVGFESLGDGEPPPPVDTPEPGALGLLGLGIVGAGLARRRRRAGMAG